MATSRATKSATVEQAPPVKKSANLKKENVATTSAVAVRPAGNIVSIQEQLKAQAAAMAERTAPPSGIKIQVTQDKTFKLPDGQTVTELLACVVDFTTVHNFYPGKFDKKNIVPPVCFAIGPNPKDMTPSANSPERQADNCQVCPNNQFGSDGEGKACKNGRRLAVLPPGDDGTGVDGEAAIWTLDVSPTALKGWDGYVGTLARTFSLPPMGFLTKISFDESVEYARLVFSDPQPLDQDALSAAYARQAEAQEILRAEPDVSGYEASKTASKPKAGVRAAAGARR